MRERGEGAPPPRVSPWLAGAAVLAFVLLNGLTLGPGHPAGGDFAQYIIHAKNLLAGLPYHHGILIKPVSFHNYPPGFPVMLTPLLAWGGLNLVLLKSLNLLFWPLACWALAAIARRRLGQPTAFYVFLFMLFCPWFFLFKQNILSDVPFACLVTAALWAFLHWQDAGPRQGAWLGLFLAYAAASLLVRSAGVALVGAVLLVMIFQRRAWGAAALTVAVALAAVALQKAMGAGTGGYFALLHDPLSWFSKVALGLPAKLAKAVGFFFPVYRSGHPLVAGLEAVAVLPLLAMAAWGWWRRRRRLGGWDVLDAFLVLYLLMILAWPFIEGPRFYAPVAGLFLLYFLEGLAEFFQGRRLPLGMKPRRLLHLVLLAGLALNLGNTALLLDYNGDVVARPADRQLYAWLGSHARPGQTYLYAYPRVLALFSGQVGDKYYWNQPLAPQRRRMAQRGVRWLVLPKPAYDQKNPSARKQFSWLFFRRKLPPSAIAQADADPGLVLVWQNQGYRVYGLSGVKDGKGSKTDAGREGGKISKEGNR